MGAQIFPGRCSLLQAVHAVFGTSVASTTRRAAKCEVGCTVVFSVLQRECISVGSNTLTRHAAVPICARQAECAKHRSRECVYDLLGNLPYVAARVRACVASLLSGLRYPRDSQTLTL